jgi:starch synthase
MLGMTILFAAGEVAPLASTGGLGDVIGSLPKFIAKLGHEVAVALPGYPALLEGSSPIGVRFEVPLGAQSLPATLHERIAPDGTQWLLIENEALFQRPGLYGENGTAYPDNASRFIFFSKAVVELARRLQPTPEVLHLHDWHTALVPALVREQRLPLTTLLTLHNLQHQGAFWGLDFPLTNLPDSWMSPSGLEFHGQLNLLKGGILWADSLTTVSAHYRREILRPGGAFGLHEVLQSRHLELFSVPNGVDPDLWNPEAPELAAPFSAANWSGKAACKQALLRETGLRPNPRGPVFAMLGRLADQKGFDLLLPLLPRLLASDSRLIVVGDGAASLRRDLLAAVRQHPGGMAFSNQWSAEFAKRVFAGADALLVPSHFEPSGLSPLYARRYGTLPIAHATGGLLEQLTDYDPVSAHGNALLYYTDSKEALWDALQRSLFLFSNPDEWRSLITRAAQGIPRWEDAANHYDALYRRPRRP